MISTIISCIFRRTLFSLAFLSILLISVTVTGFCGELRNYDLPSQEQRPHREFQEMPQRHPEDGGVYNKFREEVRRLSPEQIGRLREVFNEKLQKTKDLRERKHYRELISILEKGGSD